MIDELLKQFDGTNRNAIQRAIKQFLKRLHDITKTKDSGQTQLTLHRTNGKIRKSETADSSWESFDDRSKSSR